MSQIKFPLESTPVISAISTDKSAGRKPHCKIDPVLGFDEKLFSFLFFFRFFVTMERDLSPRIHLDYRYEKILEGPQYHLEEIRIFFFQF